MKQKNIKKTHKTLNFLLENKLYSSYIQNFFSKKFFLHVCKLGHRWCTLYNSWKLFTLAKFLKSQDFENTFQKNLTCIFLSLRANSKTQFALTDPVIIINARNHCPVNFSTYYGKKLMDSDFVHCFEDRTIMKMPPEF